MTLVNNERVPTGDIVLVMEAMDMDLDAWIKCQVVNDHAHFAVVPTLMQQLFCGLDFIHRSGLMHRDIKPSNLLLRMEDLQLKVGVLTIDTINMRLLDW